MPAYLPIREGELNASTAIRFFDNIRDTDGTLLIKSKKRAKLKEQMYLLFYKHPEQNVCTLSDGREVPIIVCRQNPHRGAFCYFNNVDAPQDEIFSAFAKHCGITYKSDILETKKQGELIANDAKQFLDNICQDGRKLAGAEKLKQLHHLFATLYADKENNQCQAENGYIPIIIARTGENRRRVYCLNTSNYREIVFQAFAEWSGCIYRQDKENQVILEPKKEEELTARQCARIFHDVPNLDGSNIKRDASPKLVEWFEYLAHHSSLNQVKLPSGKEVPLVIARKSHSQQCFCLNTADESAKPFVIWRTSEIIGATVCSDNISMTLKNNKKAYQTMKALIEKAKKSSFKAGVFYKVYAQKIYQQLNLGSELMLETWLKNKGLKR